MNEASGPYIVIDLRIVAVRRLRQVANRPGKDGKDDHELQVTPLDLLLNLAVHAFLAEANDYPDHYNDSNDEIKDSNYLIDSIIELRKFIAPLIGEHKADRCKGDGKQDGRYDKLLYALL